ncbi:C40 family peptidase [Sphingobacterium sp. DN04309]|uniref:C40 family peptidase n=2 Tax=Sphingobacterium litopenaei TaxID=2763500 RepID=A0ABR7YGM4_9SPHI|nr:C40 family peptidase [Sphingobacterium litopenaei]
MKNKFVYFCLPIAVYFGSFNNANAQVDSTIYKSIVKTLDSAKPKYAPDKRTKLLELVKADVKNNIYTIQTTENEVVSFLNKELQNSNANIQYRLLPDSTVGQKKHGVIILSVANLRTKPGHDEEMATQTLLGTQVDILQKDKGEFRVRTPEGYIAWVPTASVAQMDESEIKSWKESPKVIYTNEFGKSYSEANTKSLRVSDLVYGNILSLLSADKKFYKVKYPDGRIAFIQKEEATTFDKWLETRQLTAENVLNSAKSMLGLPYLWGGTSVKGVDCSGFTKTAFYMNGYVIPRDASQQVLAGEKIEILGADGNFDPTIALKNLKPADLLFFAGGKNSNPNARVTHVAMYIGNGEFIHSAGRVRINSMLKEASNYDDFQTRTVVAARRYIGASDPQIQPIKENKSYTK